MERRIGSVKGVFHAVVTRDGEALARDGMVVIDLRELEGTDTRGGRLFEVNFTDGLWMLATEADLEFHE